MSPSPNDPSSPAAIGGLGRIGMKIAESCPHSPNGNHDFRYHNWGNETLDDRIFCPYYKCRYCREEIRPYYDEEDGQVKFPFFNKPKTNEIPGDSAYQPEEDTMPCNDADYDYEGDKCIETPAAEEPVQEEPVQEELFECPCCFQRVPGTRLLKLSSNGQVLAQLCESCISRTLAWASKSSLGFVLSPPSRPRNSS